MTTSASARGRAGLTPVAPVVFLAPDVPDDAAEDDHRDGQDRGTPSRTPFAADESDGVDEA